MSEQNRDLSGIISDIQADVTAIVKHQIELAKAELIPQAKSAGIGAGLFGAAAYLAVMAGTLVFFGLALLLSAGFQAWFSLDVLPAATWGFLVTAVLVLLVAGVLVLIGRQRLVFTRPEVLDRAQETLLEAKEAITEGRRTAESLPLLGSRPDAGDPGRIGTGDRSL